MFQPISLGLLFLLLVLVKLLTCGLRKLFFLNILHGVWLQLMQLSLIYTNKWGIYFTKEEIVLRVDEYLWSPLSPIGWTWLLQITVFSHSYSYISLPMWSRIYFVIFESFWFYWGGHWSMFSVSLPKPMYGQAPFGVLWSEGKFSQSNVTISHPGYFPHN